MKSLSYVFAAGWAIVAFAIWFVAFVICPPQAIALYAVCLSPFGVIGYLWQRLREIEKGQPGVG